MRVDKRVEPTVRKAIHAAVIRDFPLLEGQLQKLPDDEAVRKAIELTLALIYFLMVDIHEGEPTDAEIRGVAAEIARAEAWARPADAEVTAFLSKLMKREAFAPEVPDENVIILAFVSAANLLSSCRRDEEEWWDYLDRAEAAIEAA
ncbi:hypothetical protein ACIBF5_25765 [Micromonospora sp. NPDC050417]|uniref:hypothetical protein n=1 Tax=Micromonospora sp. NPDC050417 TaxID=3364280 RepID=UPI0037A3F068